ncbi:MAG TPA: hypothetical protein VHZ26_09785 [Caulobacteraceae bacterium]|jgi:hypothetical protein|nr:hypothetical protein [Caulobacteraceae bacterium]
MAITPLLARCVVSVGIGLTAALLVSGVLGDTANAANMAGLRALLARQGFASALDRGPHGSGAMFKNMGKVRGGRTTYVVYYYDHENLEDHHGIQALVIITAAGRYVGEYDNDGDPPTKVSGHDIWFKNSPPIHFGPNGPPREIGDRFSTAAEGMCSGWHPIRSRCGARK